MKTWEKILHTPSLLSRYYTREQVIDSIREYLKKEGFHEIETPKLIPQPSTEPFLEVFETELKFEDDSTYRAFLPTSPEFAIKKLLAAGIGNVFEICKSFRNGEGRSSRHNPEFTILEFYRVNADYFDIMDDLEKMFQHIYRNVFGNENYKLTYQNKQYDLSSPWERLTVAEAFQKYAEISTEELLSEELLLIKAKEKGYAVDNTTSWEQVFNQILFNEIEPKLGTIRPTILYEYPASQAAFSRKKESDPRFAERFEVFLAGYELGNCFSELVDAKEQLARCEQDLELRKKLGKKRFGIDKDFIHALEIGFPRTSGIAMGVDRIAALFADVPSIHDVLFFPVDDLFPPEV